MAMVEAPMAHAGFSSSSAGHNGHAGPSSAEPSLPELRRELALLRWQAVGAPASAQEPNRAVRDGFQSAGIFWNHEEPVSDICLGGPSVNPAGPGCEAAGVASVAASCSWDGTVRSFDLEYWAEGPQRKFGNAPLLCIDSSQCHPGLIGCGASDGLAWLWDKDSDKQQQLRGHTKDIGDIVFHPSQDFILCTASADGTAIIWDAGKFKPLRTLRQHGGEVSSVAFFGAEAPFDHLVATVCADRQLRIWDLRVPNRRHSLPVDLEQRAVLTTASYNGMAHALVAGTDTGQIIAWDLRTLQALPLGVRSTAPADSSSPSLSAAASRPALEKVEETQAGLRLLPSIAAIAYSPCGTFLAVSSPSGEVVVVDLERGEIMPACAHNDAVYGLAWGARWPHLKGANMPFLLCTCLDNSWSCWLPSDRESP